VRSVRVSERKKSEKNSCHECEKNSERESILRKKIFNLECDLNMMDDKLSEKNELIFKLENEKRGLATEVFNLKKERNELRNEEIRSDDKLSVKINSLNLKISSLIRENVELKVFEARANFLNKELERFKKLFFENRAQIIQ
jgi:hypothetical protein